MLKSKTMVLFILILMLCILSSCWNYREVNAMAIVIGAAIDKGEKSNYLLSVELMDVGGGQETQISSEVLSMEGETIFEAVRKFISITGKRGYWGHIQVLIISEEIARKEITDVLNFFRQDSETRGDVNVLITKECTAKEILEADKTLEKVISETIGRSIENSRNLSEIPLTRLYTLGRDLVSDKISATAPAISLLREGSKTIPYLNGAAVFRKGKFTGYLSGEETKAMLFLKNEIEGGVVVVKADNSRISFEILDNNTKLKAKADKGKLTVDVTVETTVAIDEVHGEIEFGDPVVLESIKSQSEEQLKNQFENVIDKAKDCSADVFGFSQKLYEDNPKKWEEISADYEKVFNEIKVNLIVKVDIQNTSVLYEKLKER